MAGLVCVVQIQRRFMPLDLWEGVNGDHLILDKPLCNIRTVDVFLSLIMHV